MVNQENTLNGSQQTYVWSGLKQCMDDHLITDGGLLIKSLAGLEWGGSTVIWLWVRICGINAVFINRGVLDGISSIDFTSIF